MIFYCLLLQFQIDFPFIQINSRAGFPAIHIEGSAQYFYRYIIGHHRKWNSILTLYFKKSLPFQNYLSVFIILPILRPTKNGIGIEGDLTSIVQFDIQFFTETGAINQFLLPLKKIAIPGN